MKKLLAIVLAMLCLLTQTLTAYATETDITFRALASETPQRVNAWLSTPEQRIILLFTLWLDISLGEYMKYDNGEAVPFALEDACMAKYDRDTIIVAIPSESGDALAVAFYVPQIASGPDTTLMYQMDVVVEEPAMYLLSNLVDGEIYQFTEEEVQEEAEKWFSLMEDAI